MGVAILMSSFASLAQQSRIPFEQMQREARLSATRAPSNSDAASLSFPVSAPGGSSSAAASLPTPPASGSTITGFKRVPAGRGARVLDAKYLLLNGQHLVLALADIEMAQRCIDEHTCKEANPLMPSSPAAKLSVNLGIFAYATGTSYYLKKHGCRWWWAPPVAGIGIHAAGVASGIRH